MKKNFSSLKNKKGFSLVEALLAMSIFALLATAIIGGMIYGQESSALSGARVRAGFIAEEGLEAVRAIRDNGKTLPANSSPTYGLAISGGSWIFSGNQDIVDGIFTRKITVSDIDANTKKISAEVSWQQNAQRNGSVFLDSYLTNWQSPTIVTGRSMMVYSKSTNVPYYRIWDGSSWGSESSATSVGNGANIQYVVLKFSRTRDEAILGTLDSLGDIRVQVWNGSSWGSTTLVSNIGTTNDAYRGFDIEYETSGDRAIILYNNANSADPAYRIWNGSSWSGATILSAPPTTGTPYWIELASNPLSSSNEIAMMLLDSNTDTYGMVWNGSSWSNMGTGTVWDSTCAINSRKVIDIAYEQNSGEAIFIWGDSVATDQYYRTWNGSALSGSNLLDISTMGGVANWVELYARPNSNEIMYGVQDAGLDLNTRLWTGSAWDSAHPEHDASLENINSKNFDIVFETYPGNEGNAWVFWGDGSGVTARTWSSGSWSGPQNMNGDDDTSFIKMHANPGSGDLLVGIYQSSSSATDDIRERSITGGGSSWSSGNIIWDGPTSVEPTMFRIDIATERKQ